MAEYNRSYQYYKGVFKGQQMPFAFVDLDLFDENIRQIIPRAGNKKIRIASKSVRCVSLLKRVLDASPVFQGLMTYSLPETVFLSQQGFDDLLVGYPSWHQDQVKAICQELQKGKRITLMVDLAEHVQHLNRIGKEAGTVIPICMDLDMSSDFPGLHFGVWRSSITNGEKALALYKTIRASEYVRLDGLMGYEAQIAGLGDNVPGKAAMNNIVRLLKGRSVKEIAKRRHDTVKALIAAGAELKFVNGGGTGSLEWTREESVVTEVTVGSGFYASGLFDCYSNFKHLPSAAYAIEIVRKPKPGLYTCHGGGYIASGQIALNKQPLPYLPVGAKLIGQEGTGEVQTPILYTGDEQLQMGDPIFLRHSKAGELCERFRTLLLVSNGKIQGETLTYRGEGQCFV
ncbi:MAG: amino acid deaminase/aldolase [Chitinophagales bacterium]|nr:amino acid deaminase/aldolase [Chitinophagales bacterium]